MRVAVARVALLVGNVLIGAVIVAGDAGEVGVLAVEFVGGFVVVFVDSEADLGPGACFGVAILAGVSLELGTVRVCVAVRTA